MLRRNHHLDVQILAIRELAEQFVFEPHLFAAPQEESRRVVSSDDAQHPAALHFRQITVLLTVRQSCDLLDREESIEFLEQTGSVRIDCPRNRIAHERLGDDTQGRPIELEPRAVADIDRRHVQPACGHTLQQSLRRRVLRYETHLDFRVGTACMLHHMPE